MILDVISVKNEFYFINYIQTQTFYNIVLNKIWNIKCELLYK